MRRIIILSAVLIVSAISLVAQISSTPILEYRNGNFYQSGVKIEKKNLGNVLSKSEMKLYHIGKEQQIIGYVCIPAGALAIVGGGFSISNGIKIKESQSTRIIGENAIVGPLEIGLGGIIIAGGVSCIAVGTIYLCKAQKKMKKIVRKHNAAEQEITLSPSGNGFGLALNF